MVSMCHWHEGVNLDHSVEEALKYALGIAKLRILLCCLLLNINIKV